MIVHLYPLFFSLHYLNIILCFLNSKKRCKSLVVTTRDMFSRQTSWKGSSVALFLNVFDSNKNPGEQTGLITID